MKKWFPLGFIFILTVAIVAGCGQQPQPVPTPERKELTYELMKSTTAMPEGLPGLLDFVKDQPGYLLQEIDGKEYLIINLGEKPTGGFGLEIASAEIIDGKTVITVKELSPKPGDSVTQVLTYPQIVMMPTDLSEDLIIQNEKKEAYPVLAIDLKTDSGRFQSIEEDGIIQIKISGTPNELPAKSFALTPLQESIAAQMKLQKETEIRFHYVEPKEGSPIIVELSLIGK